MKKIVGLLVAGVLAAAALVAAPAVVPATSSAGGTVATTALSALAPTAAEAKRKKKSKAKAKATKSEYRKIKRGMTLTQVRKIVGSQGKRTWYYESTSSDSKCDDGYYVDGHYTPTMTWIDGYYDDYGNWIDGYEQWGEEWVDGYWVDGECWDVDLTTVYKDYKWKNNKGGYAYVSFVNGRVDSKSWYS